MSRTDPIRRDGKMLAIRSYAVSLFRVALVWGAVIAAELFVRQLFDTFAPPAPRGYGPRSALTTYAAVGTFVLLGVVEASRTRGLRSAPVVAILAGIVGHLLGIAATAILYFTVIAPDATKLTTFDMTGGWDEALAFSVVVPLIGALLAFVGALMTRAVSRAWALTGLQKART